MKHKLFSFIICAAILFLPIFGITKILIPNYETVIEQETEPLVYVTTYGENYHSGGCHYTSSSRHAIGRQKAITQGYTACSYCRGRSYQTITVEYERKKPKDDTKKSLLISSCITIGLSCFLFLPVAEWITEKRED